MCGNSVPRRWYGHDLDGPNDHEAPRADLKLHATLRPAYRELKTTQASLVHAEKMASLGQLTAGIAHEIKNLNFVNNFASLSVELLTELKDTLDSTTQGPKQKCLPDG